MFLTREELKEYVKFQERWGHGKKKRKLWMAIELEDIKKYDKPVKPKPKRFVPIGINPNICEGKPVIIRE